MDYVIGVDCGGTKTKFVAYDVKGNIITQEISGAGNILIDKLGTMTTIKEGLIRIFDSVGGNCLYFIVGIAGISTSGFLSEVESDLKVFNVPFTIVNDAVLGRMARLKGRDGIYVICGTGSVCLGYFNGVDYRIGGYGHLLGDEGSGYWLSILTYKHLTAQMDQGLAKEDMDIFTQELLAFLHVENPYDAVRDVYEKSKGEIAAISYFLNRRAQLNDPVAIAIYDKGAEAIAKQVLQLVQRIPQQPTRIPLALAGGIVENSDYLVKNIMDYLLPFGNFTLLKGKTNPTKAAYYQFNKLKNKNLMKMV